MWDSFRDFNLYQQLQTFYISCCGRFRIMENHRTLELITTLLPSSKDGILAFIRTLMWRFALVKFTSRQPFSSRLPRHIKIRRRTPGTRSRRRERDTVAGSRWRSPPRCTSRWTSWGGDDARTGWPRSD